MKKRRTLGILLSAALVVAIILTGTFALVLPRQHGSNVLNGRGADANTPSVKLIDKFVPPANWDGSEISKDVSVLNDGDVPVYVKMQLKEYMDITKRQDAYTDFWKAGAGFGEAPTMVKESICS